MFFQEPAPELPKLDPKYREPIPVVQKIDLQDESISAAYRTNLSEEDFAKEIHQQFLKSTARNELRELTQALNSGNFGSALNDLAPWHLRYASPTEAAGVFVGVVNVATGKLFREKANFILEQSRNYFPEFVRAINFDRIKDLGKIFTLSLEKQETQLIADSFAKDRLHEMAGKIKDQKIRDQFADQNMSERALLEVLKYVSPEERIQFVVDLAKASSQNSAVQSFMQGKLDNSLRFASTHEKIEIVERLLNQKNLGVSATVLGSARDLTELNEMVCTLGEAELLKLKDSAITELVALSSYTTTLRSLGFGASVPTDMSTEHAIEVLDEIDAQIQFAEDLIKARPEFLKTQVASDYLMTLAYEREYLALSRAAVSDPIELGKLAELMQAKLGVECAFGIMLSHEEPGPRMEISGGEISIVMSKGAQWTFAEVKDVEAVLKRLPEGLVLFTPLLREIQRVEYLGDYILGQRFSDGVIRIADFAVNNRIMEAVYPGVGSLQGTLTHEIGHGVQLGKDDCGLSKDSENHYHLPPGDPRYDFAEFMEVSGWKLIDPSRFEIGALGLSVTLDGEEYPIGMPIRHKGEPMVLVMNQGLLFSYKVYAPFSLVPYSRVNPWEDWAEAFAEYFLEPERLIKFAPEKFKYLEQEFRHYAQRKELLTKADEQMQKRNGKSNETKLAAN